MGTINKQRTLELASFWEIWNPTAHLAEAASSICKWLRQRSVQTDENPTWPQASSSIVLGSKKKKDDGVVLNKQTTKIVPTSTKVSLQTQSKRTDQRYTCDETYTHVPNSSLLNFLEALKTSAFLLKRKEHHCPGLLHDILDPVIYY